MKDKIGKLIGTLYCVFRPLISYDSYLYLAIGGICFVLNFIIFNITYVYFYHEKGGDPLISGHFKALLTSMIFTMPTGYLLTRSFLFKPAEGQRNYFFKYLVITLAGVYSSKLILDLLLVEMHLNVPLSYLLSIFIVQTSTFFIQKRFLSNYNV